MEFSKCSVRGQVIDVGTSSAIFDNLLSAKSTTASSSSSSSTKESKKSKKRQKKHKEHLADEHNATTASVEQVMNVCVQSTKHNVFHLHRDDTTK
jgi:hypothetical protein